MKPGNNSASIRTKLIRTALLACLILSLSPSAAHAQQTAAPKRILKLYWYDQDYPQSVMFHQSFKAALQSAPAGTVEYYPEYLESDRFPGENQSLLLHDYLRQKYADRTIDVVVASPDAPLNFLLRYRGDLFPTAPLVFSSVRRPSGDELAAAAGATGVIQLNTHRQTLDLALRLHPDTKQVLIIGGTLEHTKLETLAREGLQGYESKVRFTYLTDLTPDELIAKTKSLPERSIILYIWQQSVNKNGKLLESADLLALIAQSAPVPIYGLAFSSLGYGIIGGYVSSTEAIASRVAEIALRIANGERAQDIPIESAPAVPTFDWRQLRRWGISEGKLPPGSIVRFKELTFWDHYKWYTLGVLALFAFQASLIAALLVQRARRARAEEGHRLSEEKFSKAFHSSPDAFVLVRRNDGAIMEVNDRWETLFGYHRKEVASGSLVDLGIHSNPEDWRRFFKLIEESGFVRDFEAEVRSKRGSLHQVIIAAESIAISNEPCLLIIIRDITERMKAQQKLRELTGRLILLQDEERRRIAAELHDSLGQSLAIIRNRATICLRDVLDSARLSEQLEEISATALSAIKEVREIAHDLRPFELAQLGLAEAVESMVDKVSGATSLRLSADLDRVDGLLSPAEETSIYRIVQEGLNNVVKHAEASEARVGIKRAGGELVVSVQDNGRGIRGNGAGENGKNGGCGLAGIVERSRLLGGACTIDSEPGHGTTVTVRLQLADLPEERAGAGHERAKAARQHG